MPFLSHNDLTVSHHDIPLSRLPQALDGFRIVQISDLHFYEYSDRGYYDRVIEAVNAHKPDLIALTGDVIHYSTRYIPLAASYLERLDCPNRIAVIGNHDYSDFNQSRAVATMLDEIGYSVLRNQAMAVPAKDGVSFWIGGLDDLWHGRPDIPGTFDAVPADADVVIALSHNPLLFDPLAHYSRRQIDLVLSGHTHAGHVYLPFLKPVYRYIFQMKYRYGHFEKNNTRLYVTSGVGSAAFILELGKKNWFGLPRFRFNTRPEVAVIRLVRPR